MEARMSNAEFVKWHAWHALRSSRERLAEKMANHRR